MVRFHRVPFFMDLENVPDLTPEQHEKAARLMKEVMARPRVEMITITKQRYDELLEYEWMYKDLCK